MLKIYPPWDGSESPLHQCRPISYRNRDRSIAEANFRINRVELSAKAHLALWSHAR